MHDDHAGITEWVLTTRDRIRSLEWWQEGKDVPITLYACIEDRLSEPYRGNDDGVDLWGRLNSIDGVSISLMREN